jgi:hypothetical protein
MIHECHYAIVMQRGFDELTFRRVLAAGVKFDRFHFS